jgi:phosphatidylglycerophosphate synthase
MRFSGSTYPRRGRHVVGVSSCVRRRGSECAAPLSAMARSLVEDGGAARSQKAASRHPISRWYLCPMADRVAGRLTPTRVRPVHLTLGGLVAAGGAVAVLLGAWPSSGPLAAVLVLAAWFFDRADGLLARRQGTTSAWGAWLDANVDELVDVGLQAGVACAAARLSGSRAPWLLLAAFLAGKYLFTYGLVAVGRSSPDGGTADSGEAVRHSLTYGRSSAAGFLRRCYHLPGNADVRVHLLVVALLTGWLAAELVLVAVYYNVRWIVRYVLVARRLGRVSGHCRVHYGQDAHATTNGNTR